MNSPYSSFDPNTSNSSAPLTNDDKQWAMLAHLASLAGFMIPFGHVGGPLLVWLLKKEQSPFIDDQGKEALNFQISMTIYLTFAALSCFLLIGFVLFPLVALADLVLTVIGAVRANNGETYRYPMTIRFLK